MDPQGTTQVRISTRLHLALKVAVAQDGATMREVLDDLIRDYLEARDGKGRKAVPYELTGR